MDPEFVENGKHQVRHRGMRGRLQVSAAFDLARRASDQQNRQRVVIVLIAVAQSAAVKNEGVIKQVSVAVWCFLQLVEK
jgi:hypothetical protein